MPESNLDDQRRALEETFYKEDRDEFIEKLRLRLAKKAAQPSG